MNEYMVIKREDESHMYPEYRTIVDYAISICEPFNGKDIRITINNRIEHFNAGYHYDYYKKEFYYTLNIGIDSINNRGNKYVAQVNELDSYFKMYNIESKKSYWVFAVLHELGHIDYYIRYHISKSKLNKMIQLEKIQMDALKLAFNINSQKKFIELYYMQSVELYANQFAYRYFPYVWNNLKNMNLI